MYFSQLLINNLWRRPTRTCLTVFGLVVAVSASTTLLSISTNFVGATTEFYSARGVDVVVVRAGVADRLNSSLDVAVVRSLESLPGIAAVDGTLTEMITLQEGGGWIGIPLHGFAPGGFALGHLRITAGRSLNRDDRHAALLGASLATSLGKRPGDSLEIEGTRFDIIGLFQADSPLESSTIVASLADVQELMDRGGQVSEFQVRADPHTSSAVELRALCQRIERLRDDTGRSYGFKALPTRDYVATGTETRLAQAMAWGTSVLAMVLSGVGMLNTMLMSVLERTREIGILRAIGWSRFRIVRMIFGESILLSLVGAACGTLGAVGLVGALAAWSVTANLVVRGVPASAMGWGAVLALVAGTVGAGFPAWQGASVMPLEALRYE